MKKADRERISGVLFPASRGQRTDIPWISRRTGIPECTLRRYRKMPEQMTLERFVLIVRELGLDAEQVGQIVTGGKHGTH